LITGYAAAHHNALGHYLGSFALYTLLAVGVLYLLFWLIKTNPHLRQYLGRSAMAQSRQPNGGLQQWLMGRLIPNAQGGKGSVHLDSPLLQVEATVVLEPQKTLYVVRADNQRWLIASTLDALTVLAPLNPANSALTQADDLQPVVNDPNEAPSDLFAVAPSPLTPSASVPRAACAPASKQL